MKEAVCGESLSFGRTSNFRLPVCFGDDTDTDRKQLLPLWSVLRTRLRAVRLTTPERSTIVPSRSYIEVCSRQPRRRSSTSLPLTSAARFTVHRRDCSSGFIGAGDVVLDVVDGAWEDVGRLWGVADDDVDDVVALNGVGRCGREGPSLRTLDRQTMHLSGSERSAIAERIVLMKHFRQTTR